MKSIALLALPALLLALPPSVWAGPGHDHGPEAPAPTSAALPRFAAESELFELVGVLEGQSLRLYLDRAATNEPLPRADIELELAGQKLRPQAEADGSFAVALPQGLGEGVHAVTATITVGEEADLLAGELDVHGAGTADAHAHWGWPIWAGPAAAGLAGLGGLVVGLARRRSRAAARASGVAA